MRINIDNSEVVSLTNKLEKMRKSDLPVVVNQTLNSAAIYVRGIALPKSVQKNFDQRNKNFFKANSRFNRSKGFNIDSMFSEVGFINSSTNESVRNLEVQERGGTIKDRSFIAMDKGRVSDNQKKSVRRNNRLSKIKDLRNIDKLNKSKKNRVFHSQVKKAGVGGFILYKNIVFEVKRIQRGNIKLKGIYSFQENRSVKIERTNFMREASEMVNEKKMNQFFLENARRRIKLSR